MSETKTPAQLSYPDRYYAQYDPKAAQPSLVLGWYDMWNYSSLEGLPSLSNLLPLTEDYWKDHLINAQTPKAVQDGKIVGYTPPKTLEGQQSYLSNITIAKKSLGVYFTPDSSKTPVLFASDDAAYSFALQEAQTVQLGAYVDGTAWDLPNGQTIPMNGSDVTALFKKMVAYRSACQNYSSELGKQLEGNVSTDLDSGWPSNE